MRITLLLCCLFSLSLSLSAQDVAPTSPYSLSTNYGLAGLLGEETLNRGIFVSSSLDRRFELSKKSNVIAGLGLQYTNHEQGTENARCDFPLGNKIVTFTFSETYEFNSLDATLRLGIEHTFGQLTVRGLLLPTLRLHDRITSTNAIFFDQLGRPDQFVSNKVTPGEEFIWTDGYRRELRYNTPASIQGALEIDYAVGKRLGIGLGYQLGLTKYELTNYFLTQEFITPDGGPCGIAGCPLIEEYTTTVTNARTARGYLALRVSL